MEEKEIYKIVLKSLFDGLRTDNHDKFLNDRTSVREFAVGDLYPDVILTKKGSTEIEFIVEIVIKSHLKKQTLFDKWEPLSKIGPTLYLLVPKADQSIVEKWCSEQKLKARFGSYEMIANQAQINFY